MPKKHVIKAPKKDPRNGGDGVFEPQGRKRKRVQSNEPPFSPVVNNRSSSPAHGQRTKAARAIGGGTEKETTATRQGPMEKEKEAQKNIMLYF